jgi:hypothetical protein
MGTMSSNPENPWNNSQVELLFTLVHWIRCNALKESLDAPCQELFRVLWCPKNDEIEPLCQPPWANCLPEREGHSRRHLGSKSILRDSLADHSLRRWSDPQGYIYIYAYIIIHNIILHYTIILYRYCIIVNSIIIIISYVIVCITLLYFTLIYFTLIYFTLLCIALHCIT